MALSPNVSIAYYGSIVYDIEFQGINQFSTYLKGLFNGILLVDLYWNTDIDYVSIDM
jgi:hypothetical protein